MRNLIATFAAAFAVCALGATAEGPAPLKLVQTFKLPSAVKGHFDHFGVDLPGHRLFATAERYNSVLVMDFGAGKLIHTIGGSAYRTPYFTGRTSTAFTLRTAARGP